ncbi:hypothetical protein FHG87_001721 [Trinorchestia longiramus]|nr:hypothetical protein FHG87_001721 [Trinorchestia longiramus]
MNHFNLDAGLRLVGDVAVSLLGAVAAVMAAAYLVSGHITVSCVSDLHRLDKSTAIRLYILDFTAIVASIPCIAGAVASFIAAALSAQATRSPKKKLDAPVVLFLRGWSDDEASATVSTSVAHSSADVLMSTNTSTEGSNSVRGASHIQQHASRAQEAGHSACRGAERCPTPPPNYNQVTRESFA